MNILFIHPNFPAQFRHMAQWFGRNGHKVVFATENPRPEWEIPGVVKAVYKSRKPAAEGPPLFQPLQPASAHAEAMLVLGEDLKKRGFDPDVVCGASGWGPTWFARDLFPKARLVGYFEWFYNPESADSMFDRKEPLSAARSAQLRLRNTVMVNDLLACNLCITPSKWQRQQFPAAFQDRMVVLHDGIDTQYFSPDEASPLEIPGLPLSGREKIVTYATRGMEPYRGFPQFIEALPRLLAEVRDCHVVIAGEDRICYGAQRSDGKSWKQAMLERVPLPAERVHFVGRLPYGQYRQLLRCSKVHLYLTRPFVLSWSMLEAMSCGCLLVASDTEPVREVVRDEVNGLLVDFHDPHKIAERIIDALGLGSFAATIQENARATIVERYDLEKILARQISLLALK
jgi:glycosyltransferase involved in cell wall biosynthesis